MGGLRSWRTIATTLALLCGPVVLVVLRAHHPHRHPKSGDLATALLVGIGLATLYVGLAALLDSRRDKPETGDPSLADVADQLAAAVRVQWEAEAEVRRLNDPYPLPVSWVAADKSLTDGWDLLVTLATSGAGWPAPPSPGTWADSPEGLVGADNDLVHELARVPTGRLVVLGEPGAGKSMLMVRLALDLLARRASGGPVPVLASLASWNPQDQDLHGWLAAQLTIDHPALAGSAPPDARQGTRIAALLAAGLILPILDGLDEIPDAVRGPAITRINDALRPGELLVVTCRTEQYRDALRPPSSYEATLRAAAVQLCPLDIGAVRQYLCDDAAGPVAAARFAQALTTPLMVGLARTIYNPRPGERAGDLRDPAELCNPTLPDRAAVEEFLFDGFIPAAYRPGLAGRWTVQRAEKWLVFLARHLDHKIHSPDLAWWQLQWAVPRPLVFGSEARQVDETWLQRAGPPELLRSTIARARGEPSRGIRFGIGEFSTYMVAGIAGGLLIDVMNIIFDIGGALIHSGFQAMPLRVALEAWLRSAIAPIVVFGFLFGVIGGIWNAMKSVPSDLATAASPHAVLARDRHAALVLWLECAAGLGFVGGITAVLLRPLPSVLVTIVLITVGLAVGFVPGFILSVRETAWPTYCSARGWLALRHRLPWPLMAFLADAHQRGVLRQAGAVYQFRHIELQHRLATRR